MKKRIMKKQRKAQSAPAFFTSADQLVESDLTSQSRKSPAQEISQSLPKEPSSEKVTRKTPSHQVRSPKPHASSKSDHSDAGVDRQDLKPNKRPYRKANYAFIDGQNLNKAIQSQGWSLDYREFRKYLEEKYQVRKAYIFIGLITTNQTLYSALQDFGYHLVFKPTIANKFGDVKGNVDAEMVLYAITVMEQYNKAVIVSGDGDFYTLVQYLQSKGKLEKLLVPNEQAYSALFDTLDIDTSFVTDLRNKLEYTKHNKR